MDKRDAGQTGGIHIFLRIADIDRAIKAVATHDKADVFPLDQAGAFPLLIVGEEIAYADGRKEGVHVAALAVADDTERIALADQ